MLLPAMVALYPTTTKCGRAAQLDASHGLGLCWRQGVLLTESFSVITEDTRNGSSRFCITCPCRRLRATAGVHLGLPADAFLRPHYSVQETMLLAELCPSHADIPTG